MEILRYYSIIWLVIVIFTYTITLKNKNRLEDFIGIILFLPILIYIILK